MTDLTWHYTDSASNVGDTVRWRLLAMSQCRS